MGLVPYIGGDSKIVHFIYSLLPKGWNYTFIEPFGGAGSVSLYMAEKKVYKRVIWNDKDFYVYAGFYVIKYHPEVIPEIQEELDKIRRMFTINRLKLKEDMRKLRREFIEEREKDIIKAGKKFLILYYTCLVPYLSGLMFRWTDNPNRFKNVGKKLLRCHKILQDVEIMNRDAFDLIREYNSKDVVMYVDPPHIIYGNKYYRLELTKELVRELDKLLDSSSAKILVKLEKNDLPYYPNVTKWRRIIKDAPRGVKPGERYGQKFTRYYFFANYKLMITLDDFLRKI